MPSTPTVSSRSRAAIFGLDAISRNLFNALPGSSKGDIFGGSMNSHRRSKTTASRSSVYTQSTSTGDSSLSRFSRSRSNSTVTSATTMSFMEDESAMPSDGGSGNSRTRARSLSKAKKLLKRGKSPGGSGSEREPSPPRLHSRLSQSTSNLPDARERSLSVERGKSPASDWEEEETFDLRASRALDESERDLAARLELARRNSQNQREAGYTRTPIEPPLEETIYEGVYTCVFFITQLDQLVRAQRTRHNPFGLHLAHPVHLETYPRFQMVRASAPLLPGLQLPAIIYKCLTQKSPRDVLGLPPSTRLIDGQWAHVVRRLYRQPHWLSIPI